LSTFSVSHGHQSQKNRRTAVRSVRWSLRHIETVTTIMSSRCRADVDLSEGIARASMTSRDVSAVLRPRTMEKFMTGHQFGPFRRSRGSQKPLAVLSKSQRVGKEIDDSVPSPCPQAVPIVIGPNSYGSYQMFWLNPTQIRSLSDHDIACW
jgi:hypothetical protein